MGDKLIYVCVPFGLVEGVAELCVEPTPLVGTRPELLLEPTLLLRLADLASITKPSFCPKNYGPQETHGIRQMERGRKK